MILELDVGNSRIKWRLLNRQNPASSSEGYACDVEEFVALPAVQKKPDMVRMCSVRRGETCQQIEQWVADKFGLQVQKAEVARCCGGVTNQYADLAGLGVDRWLAMLAAYKRAAGACIVFDSGTAFTVDVLNAEGEHLGGHIVPGLGLMRRSLVSNTGISLSATPEVPSTALGHSTDAAVCNGTLAVLSALIDCVVGENTLQNAVPKLYFTGGDADLLANMLPNREFEVVPGLVLDGLAVACPYQA